MTPNQEKRYWSARDGWGAVTEANLWYPAKGVAGRLLADPIESAGKSVWHGAVWERAYELRAAYQPVTSDHLRHAAHRIALHRPRSHKDFTNEEFDRVLCLFAVLIDPENLRAAREQVAYEKYDEWLRATAGQQPTPFQLSQRPDHPGERRRELWFIRTKDAPFVLKILRDEHEYFGTTIIDDLPLEKLRSLTRTLKNRCGTARSSGTWRQKT